MHKINLLPWRQQKRQYEKNKFIFVSLANLCFVCFIVFLMNAYLIFFKSKQFIRNQLLKVEIRQVEGRIKKFQRIKRKQSELILNLKRLRTLQSRRLFIVHLFAELIKVLPCGVCLTRLERQTNKIYLWGYSKSNSTISKALKNMENNKWIQKPRLAEIKKMEGKTMRAWNAFKLNFTVLSK